MRLLPAALLALCLATPAAAETDWAAYGSFSGTRCEDEKTIADIRESLKGLTFNEGGGRAFALATSIAITRSRTVSATPTRWSANSASAPSRPATPTITTPATPCASAPAAPGAPTSSPITEPTPPDAAPLPPQ